MREQMHGLAETGLFPANDMSANGSIGRDTVKRLTWEWPERRLWPLGYTTLLRMRCALAQSMCSRAAVSTTTSKWLGGCMMLSTACLVAAASILAAARPATQHAKLEPYARICESPNFELLSVRKVDSWRPIAMAIRNARGLIVPCSAWKAAGRSGCKIYPVARVSVRLAHIRLA